MQKTERYGVLALLLLVITLVAVGAWGERPDEETAVVHPQRRVTTQPRPVDPGPVASVPRASLPLDRRLSEERARLDRSRDTRQRVAEAHRNAQDQERQLAQEQRIAQAQEQRIAQAPEDHQGAPIETPPSRPIPFSTSPAPTERVHIVRSGEVFGSIVEKMCGGRRFNGQVLALNPGLNPDRIRVGQRILLPARSVSLETERRTAATSSPQVAQVEATHEPTSQSSGRVRSLNVYVVESGDMLSRIISANCPPGVKLDDVVALNGGMDPNRIFVGQELRLPRSATRSAAPPSSKRASKEAPSGPTYRVRSGDVLGRIASGWGCSLASIVSMNPGLNPDRIREGLLLQMPPRRLDAQLEDAPRLAKVSGLGGRSWSGVK